MPELTLEQVVDNVMASAEVSAPEPTAPTASEAPAAEATPETPATEASAPAAATPTPADLSDDTLVSVVVDGETVQMSWKDARRGISHTAASTKRFQEAAELRKQAEAERAQVKAEMQTLAQMRAQLDGIVRDPQKLAAFYMAQQAQANGQPAHQQAQPSPVDLAAYSQQLLAQADTLVQQRLAEVQQRETATRIERDLTTYTDSLLQSHPVLSAVPGFADKVYETVAKMGPRDMDQAKEWIAAQVDEVKAKLSQQLGETAKAAAVAKAKAVNATERGGSPVLPAPKTYAGLDDPQRDADMLALLNSLS